MVCIRTVMIVCMLLVSGGAVLGTFDSYVYLLDEDSPSFDTITLTLVLSALQRAHLEADTNHVPASLLRSYLFMEFDPHVHTSRIIIAVGEGSIVVIGDPDSARFRSVLEVIEGIDYSDAFRIHGRPSYGTPAVYAADSDVFDTASVYDLFEAIRSGCYDADGSDHSSAGFVVAQKPYDSVIDELFVGRDECRNGGLVTWYCGGSGEPLQEYVVCPGGCERGVCLEPVIIEHTDPPSDHEFDERGSDENRSATPGEDEVEPVDESVADVEPCQGCVIGGSCMPYGSHIDDEYCSSLGVFAPVAGDGSSCSYDYECRSNRCVSGVCDRMPSDQPTLIERIVSFFTRFFTS